MKGIGLSGGAAGYIETNSDELKRLRGRPSVIYEVEDLPGRPQYRWDGGKFVAAVTADVDPLTGGIKSGGRALRWPRSIITSYQPWPIIETNAGSDLSRHIKFRAPVDFDAVKVRVKHVGASVVNNHKLTIGVSTNATGYQPTGGYNNVLFSGVLEHTCTAKPANAPWSVIESDPVLLKSIDGGDGGRCYIHMMEYCPPAVQMSRSTMAASPHVGDGFVDGALAYQAGIDATADPNLFASPVFEQATGMPVEMLFYSRDKVRKIAVVSASTGSGTGDTASPGWVGRACAALNTSQPDFAWIWSNFGKPSDPTANTLNRGLAEIARGEYEIAIYYPFTINDPSWSTEATRNQQVSRAAIFVESCIKVGTVPVLATFQPIGSPTSWSGAEETSRRAAQQAIRDYATAVGVTVIDVDMLLTNYSAPIGGWIDASLTSDGLHPNAAGHAAIAAYAAPIIGQI